MKYLKEVRDRFKGSAAFTVSDLKIFLSRKGISREYLHLLVHNLIARGEIKKISRGAYTFRDDIEVVGFAFQPFYYGLQEALSLRNLWEQETNPIVITPRRVRSGVRTFEGSNYIVKRMRRSMFFGFQTMKYKDLWIPASDTEKTLIDFVYFKEPLSAEALAEIKKQIDKGTLSGYLKRCPAWVKKRILKLLKEV